MKLKLVILYFLLLLLQLALFEELRIFDVPPNIMLLFSVAAVLAGYPNLGIYSGFGLGLAYDLFLPTTLGLSCLAYTLNAFLVRYIDNVLANPTKWNLVILGAAGNITGMLGFILLGELLNQNDFLTLDAFKILGVAAVIGVALIMPAARLTGVICRTRNRQQTGI